jgi:hypothetical protein
MGGTGSEAPSGGAPKVAAATGAKVVFQQPRTELGHDAQAGQAELRKLEEAILAQSKDQPDLQQIAEGTKNLYRSSTTSTNG